MIIRQPTCIDILRPLRLEDLYFCRVLGLLIKVIAAGVLMISRLAAIIKNKVLAWLIVWKAKLPMILGLLIKIWTLYLKWRVVAATKFSGSIFGKKINDFFLFMRTFARYCKRYRLQVVALGYQKYSEIRILR